MCEQDCQTLSFPRDDNPQQMLWASEQSEGEPDRY